MGCMSSKPTSNANTSIVPQSTQPTKSTPLIRPPHSFSKRNSIRVQPQSQPSSTPSKDNINELIHSNRKSMRLTTSDLNMNINMNNNSYSHSHNGTSATVLSNNNRSNVGAATDLNDSMGLSSRRGIGSVILMTDTQIEAMKQSGGGEGGINWCDMNVWSGRMDQCFQHYARKPECDVIEKKVISQIAIDCVHSTINALKRELKQKHSAWNDSKIEKEVNQLIPKYLAGKDDAERIEIAEYYLRHELRLHDNVVTKACFFLHFPRVHRNAFSTGQLNIEREVLVNKLTNQHSERQQAYVKSMKTRDSTARLTLNNDMETPISNKKLSATSASQSVRMTKRKSHRATHRGSFNSFNAAGGMFSDEGGSSHTPSQGPVTIAEEHEKENDSLRGNRRMSTGNARRTLNKLEL